VINREQGDREEEWYDLAYMCEVRIDEGRYEEALDYGLQSVKIARETYSLGSYSNDYVALAYFYANRLEEARRYAEIGLQANEPLNNDNVAVLLGIITLRLGDRKAAIEAFDKAIEQADEMLTWSEQNYDSMDSKGLALCGLTLCSKNGNHTASAIQAFRTARKINCDAGHLKRTIQLLDAIAQCDSTAVLALVREALLEYAQGDRK
jgi:tetratricopeptide (TPR) repeat protein